MWCQTTSSWPQSHPCWCWGLETSILMQVSRLLLQILLLQHYEWLFQCKLMQRDLERQQQIYPWQIVHPCRHPWKGKLRRVCLLCVATVFWGPGRVPDTWLALDTYLLNKWTNFHREQKIDSQGDLSQNTGAKQELWTHQQHIQREKSQKSCPRNPLIFYTLKNSGRGGGGSWT